MSYSGAVSLISDQSSSLLSESSLPHRRTKMLEAQSNIGGKYKCTKPNGYVVAKRTIKTLIMSDLTSIPGD